MSSPSDAFPDPGFRPSRTDFELFSGRAIDASMRRGNWTAWRLIVQVAIPGVAVLILASLAFWGQNLSLETLEGICGAIIVVGIVAIIAVTMAMFPRRAAITGLAYTFAIAFAAVGILVGVTS